MSTLAETARQEGDDAEAAEEEETPTAPTEPTEPEPEPAPAEPASQMTEQEAEREFKKLEKLAETYLPKALALSEKLGIPALACPLCTFPGLAIPRSENEVTSDVEAAVLGMIGKSAPADFKTAPDYERCAQCDGWGEVLTGAQKEISKTAPCNLCGGKGFRNVVVPVSVTPPNGQPQYPGASVPFQPVPGGMADQWGRPAGHVHWGIDPAAVGV
jgi:pyruvate/2-oxoglutarate dehydrogenase complex dihydrolipoamide acyltransferase (E2) component